MRYAIFQLKLVFPERMDLQYSRLHSGTLPVGWDHNQFFSEEVLEICAIKLKSVESERSDDLLRVVKEFTSKHSSKKSLTNIFDSDISTYMS